VTVTENYSETYAEARSKFLAAVSEAGATPETYLHPLKGPDGGELAADIVRFGPDEAERVLVVASATHGIEGYCGSGIQISMLKNGLQNELPTGTALVLVHAHNPHGFAHGRRVTEDNVDLNRNFQDFDKDLPANPDYDEVHDRLVPANWEGPAREAADKAIAEFIETRGMFAFQAAVSTGQYDHADGLFYGGRQPTWSRRLIEENAGSWCRGASKVAFIDLHTGLGPRGFGELISVDGGRGGDYERARQWYGDDVKSPSAGDSVSAEVQGTIDQGYLKALGPVEFTAIALEYGTIPPQDVLQALRADNWLHLHGEVDSELGRAIKKDVRAAFFGEEAEWKESVWQRALEISRKALNGLEAS